MMMLIFSSFDALSAEALGQKKFISFSWVAAKEGKVRSASSPGNISEGLKKDNDGGKSSTVTPKDVDKSKSNQQGRRQRFAPELDGVHCFETIIPY